MAVSYINYHLWGPSSSDTSTAYTGYFTPNSSTSMIVALVGANNVWSRYPSYCRWNDGSTHGTTYATGTKGRAGAWIYFITKESAGGWSNGRVEFGLGGGSCKLGISAIELSGTSGVKHGSAVAGNDSAGTWYPSVSVANCKDGSLMIGLIANTYGGYGASASSGDVQIWNSSPTTAFTFSGSYDTGTGTVNIGYTNGGGAPYRLAAAVFDPASGGNRIFGGVFIERAKEIIKGPQRERFPIEEPEAPLGWSKKGGLLIPQGV